MTKFDIDKTKSVALNNLFARSQIRKKDFMNCMKKTDSEYFRIYNLEFTIEKGFDNAGFTAYIILLKPRDEKKMKDNEMRKEERNFVEIWKKPNEGDSIWTWKRYEFMFNKQEAEKLLETLKDKSEFLSTKKTNKLASYLESNQSYSEPKKTNINGGSAFFCLNFFLKMIFFVFVLTYIFTRGRIKKQLKFVWDSVKKNYSDFINKIGSK